MVLSYTPARNIVFVRMSCVESALIVTIWAQG